VTDDPYRLLVALAEREYALVLEGDFDALEVLMKQRDAVVAGLPGQTPASARPALTEAARIQAKTTAALDEARTRVAGELAALDRGLKTATGYGRAAGTEPRQSTITLTA
jgi:hypothetical protein